VEGPIIFKNLHNTISPGSEISNLILSTISTDKEEAPINPKPGVILFLIKL